MAKKNHKSNQKSNLSSRIIFWAIGLVAILVIGFIFLGNHSSQAQSNQQVTIDYSHVPYFGKASAPVSIIEFGDYKCSNCKEFNENAIPSIKQQLIDTGKAKLYFMNDSFINTDSIRSAKFAESVYEELGNQTFWKFHDLLYQKQPADSKYETMDIYTEKFLTDTLKGIVSQADVNKVIQNFDAKKSDAAWQRDMALAKKLHVDGTPTLFVNGKLFTGNTIDDLTKMVDQAVNEK